MISHVCKTLSLFTLSLLTASCVKQKKTDPEEVSPQPSHTVISAAPPQNESQAKSTTIDKGNKNSDSAKCSEGEFLEQVGMHLKCVPKTQEKSSAPAVATGSEAVVTKPVVDNVVPPAPSEPVPPAPSEPVPPAPSEPVPPLTGPTYDTFQKWCDNKTNASVEAQKTINAILGAVGVDVKSPDACSAAVRRAQIVNNLMLYGKDLTDLRPLASLEPLLKYTTILSLENNRITDLSLLSGFSRISELWLGGNRIENIQPLSSLKSLKFLILQKNQIRSLSGIQGLVGLEEIWINQNSISDISQLGELKNLKILALGRNQIANLLPLTKLPALETLYASNNKVTDSAPISELKALKILWLKGHVRLTKNCPVGKFTVCQY